MPSKASLIPSSSLVQLLINKILNNPTVTGCTVEQVNAVSGGGASALVINLATGSIQRLTTTSNSTITLPAPVAGKAYTVIVQFGGVHTLTWAGGGTIKWAGGAVPAATAVNGKVDIFVFTSDGTNTYGRTGGSNY